MNSIKIFSGFTFIELLVSLTILAVLLSLATPSFQRSITRSAIKTQAWEIRRALELARGLALTQQQIWKVCIANSAAQCVKQYGERLLVFRDSDNNYRVDDSDLLYRDHRLSDLDIKLSASGRRAVRYKPNGEAMDSGNFLVCGNREITDFGRQAIIFRSGRVRLTRDSDNDGYDEKGAQKIQCP
jgi:type IV fimbrial biogenesis protein FimT